MEPAPAQASTTARAALAGDPADWPTVVDGELTTAGRAAIPVLDDGLIRGDGAFDAFPVRDGRPFGRRAHLDRLERSCAALRLHCPRAQIEADVDRLLALAPAGLAVVRIILTRGGRRLSRLEPPGDPAALARPVALAPVTYDPTIVLNGAKTLSYAANMLATRLAAEQGADEALLVSSEGIVLEGPTCSVFWVAAGRLRTPGLDTGILASITRRAILERLDAQEGAFALDDLLGASEAFLASSGRFAQPIATVGQVRLPEAPGPVTLRAQAALEAAMAEGSPA